MVEHFCGVHDIRPRKIFFWQHRIGREQWILSWEDDGHPWSIGCNARRYDLPRNWEVICSG